MSLDPLVCQYEVGCAITRADVFTGSELKPQLPTSTGVSGLDRRQSTRSAFAGPRTICVELHDKVVEGFAHNSSMIEQEQDF